MPYCPKCDMEFIEGITTCSDCGGPLLESKEVADALKQKEREEELARRQAQLEAMQEDADGPDTEFDRVDPGSNPAEQIERLGRAYAHNHVYVKKSQQYDDLKSSASAFLLVGAILLIFSALCWLNIIRLPMSGLSGTISQGVMTLMGIGSLLVAFSSSKSAKKVEGQIAEEETATGQLVEWFTGSYTGERLDEQIRAESGELGPEELSLKRFDLIQDILITNHDIADQAYVDLLAEDIYEKLYGEDATA